MFTVLFVDGSLAGDIGAPGSSQLWSTLAGLLPLLALTVAGRRAPQAIRATPLTVIAILLTLTGHAACLASLRGASHVLGTVGISLVGVAASWGLFMLLLACTSISLWRVCVCFAGAGLASLVAVAALEIVGIGTYGYLALDALFACGALVTAFPHARDFLERAGRQGAPTDMEVARPEAFLSLRHAMFAYILVFSLACGFAGGSVASMGESSYASYVLTALALAVMTAQALVRRSHPNADRLFYVSFALVVCGFSFVLVGDARTEALAASLLIAGYMVFFLLVWFVLSAAAARSIPNAVPTVAWGLAADSLGIVLGALLFDLCAALPEPLVGEVAVALLLSAIVIFNACTIRSFSFDATVEGIEPCLPGDMPEPTYIDRIEERCEAASAAFNLTQREAEVMAQLARGNNASHIEESLGIAYNTVKYHARNVYRKMDVHSQQELIDLVSRENPAR